MRVHGVVVLVVCLKIEIEIGRLSTIGLSVPELRSPVAVRTLGV